MKNYLSVHRVALKLGIKAYKIYRLIRKGKLIEGTDYKRITKTVVRLEVRDDLELK